MRDKPAIEVVDVDDRRREIEGILRHYLARVKHDPAGFSGMMIVIEQPGGAFEMKYTGSSNVAERVGRLEILKDAMLDHADEVAPEVVDSGAGFQRNVARRRRGPS